MGAYRDVQFIGYAIPTIPLDIGDVGGPNDDYNFIEGRYIGLASQDHDIDARIALVMNAARQTLHSGAVDASASTLKIFVVPEFSFRGKRGAYNHDPTFDPFTYFRKEFAERAADPAFQGWLFVIGTFMSTTKDVTPGNDPKGDLEARVREDLGVALGKAWQLAHKNDDQALAKTALDMLITYTDHSQKNPLYEITDRCYVVPGGAPSADYPEGLSVEKKFLSPEDFVLNLYATAIFAEANVGFPPIDERDGEDKKTAFDELGIFTIEGIKCGIEVCFDHSSVRLRKNRRPATELVQIHLVPSCGMQIIQRSIIACAGGLVFNCDGQYGDLDATSRPNTDDSLWTANKGKKAHTQLTQVHAPCGVGNDPKSAPPATLVKPAATVTVIPIEDPSAKLLYAYGAGEVHVYTPLPIPALP